MTDADHPSDQPEPFGNYTLLERTDAGAAIESYVARVSGTEGFERLVTLRRPRPDAPGDVARALVDGARRAAALQHANIAQILDIGRVGETPYVATELADGPSLADLLARAESSGEPFPPELACHLAGRVLEVIGYVHEKLEAAGEPIDALSLALTPYDVRVSRDGLVKVTSAGVPAAAGGADPRMGYMSPEQVRGLSVDRRSDTFVAGVLLFELLTGQRLFAGESEFEVLEKIRKVEVTPPSLLNPSIPAELEEVVLRALSPTMSARYQTAHHMARELQRAALKADYFAADADLRGYLLELEASGPIHATVPVPLAGATRPQRAHDGDAVGTDGLDWGEEEVETSIFGRGRASAPAPDEELGAWSEGEGTLVRPAGGTAAAATRSDEAGASEPAAPVAGAALAVPSPAAPAVPSASVPVVHVRPSPDAPAGGLEPRVERFTPARPAAITSAQTARSPVAPAASGAPAERSTGWMWVAAVLLLGLVVYLVVGRREPDAFVQLNTTPAVEQAVVAVDGATVYQGALPARLPAMAPGQRAVTIRAPGFRERTERVEVVAGVPLALNWELSRVPTVSVPFRTTPAGAKLLVDGREVGVTPTTVDLEVGASVTLELALAGHTPHRSTFRVGEGAAAVTIALTAETDGSGDAAALAAAPTLAEGSAVNEAAGVAEASAAPDEAPAAAAEPGMAQEPVAAAVAPSPAPRTPAAASAPPASARPERETPAPARPAAPERTATRTDERPAPSRPTPPVAPAAPPAAPPAAQPPAQPPAADGPPGFVTVQSNPPARVLINGADTGLDTPVSNLPLAPGAYRIELVNDAAGVRRTYRINVESGRTRSIVNQAQ